MAADFKTPPGGRRRPTWREYQQRLRRPRKVVTFRRMLLTAAVLATVFYALFMGMAATRPDEAAVVPPPAAAVNPVTDSETLLSKSDVQLLLTRMPLADLMHREVVLPLNEQQLRVTTCLDETLQARLVKALDRRHARYIGIVVMEPETGRVRAMVGFDKADPDANPCLSSIFPAASLFKIVTAAAAVDQFNYTGKTPLKFNGYKHTLYRNQLQETDNRYTHTISLSAAFAESVNPVFGKLGKLDLGKLLLEQYGADFGFNRPIDFDLPIDPSHLAVKETPYHWAEIASGFNRETTLSPLHAAMIISAALNQGRMAVPTLIERIEDQSGRLLYLADSTHGAPAMSGKAADALMEMMEATVRSGTARSLFRNRQRDPVLSALRIGGKTGSISTRDREARIDWFAGYAEKQKGRERLVVAALVAHEEYIGVRAGTYARTAMTHYFKNSPTRRQTAGGPSGG